MCEVPHTAVKSLRMESASETRLIRLGNVTRAAREAGEDKPALIRELWATGRYKKTQLATMADVSRPTLDAILKQQQ